MPRGVYNRGDDNRESKLDEAIQNERNRRPHGMAAADAARAKGTARPGYGEGNANRGQEPERTPRALTQQRGERESKWLRIVDQQLDHREISAVRFDDGGSTMIVEFDD